MNIILNPAFLIVTIGASIGQMLSRDWRWNIGFLGAQYLGVFWFVQTIWPFNLAIIKLISGMIVCLALATSQKSTASFAKPETAWPQGYLFRLLAAALIVLATLAVTPPTSTWLGLNNPIGTWVSLLLISIGLLQLGITTQPLRVIIALLTLISGFEIIYAFVETSALVAAMLVLINLGLSLVGTYLLSTENVEIIK
jgi:hypothetical protein